MEYAIDNCLGDLGSIVALEAIPASRTWPRAVGLFQAANSET
jgi:hypothetical protein